MPEDSSIARPGVMLTHYRLVEKAGEGGMGVVWKAEDTILNRPVAIKILPADRVADENRRSMFLREARAAASIGDAHIVGIHEFAQDAGVDFIVMEYVDGRPLDKLIHGKPMAAEKVADIGHQVAHAVSKAHRKGLLHRDIKPSNILVTPEGEAKVVDFGLATLFAPHEVHSTTDIPDIADASTLTDIAHPGPRPIAGTLPYMSPEQVRGEKLDARSDIFSFGAVLYEMTTGLRPFDATGRAELAAQVQKARVVAPHQIIPKVPLDLDRLILKAMAPKPQDRYQTMEDLAVDLKHLGRDLETGSSPSYEALQAPAAKKKLTWPRWAALGLFVATAVFVGWLIVPGRWQSQPTTGGDVTLLILPLEVRGQAEGRDYVGRAFAESLAVSLAQARGIRVLPVPAKGVGPDAGATEWARLAREAGADRVLTGALTREGETAQASLMLVNAAENRIIWGSQQGQVTSDLLRLTSLLAGELTRALGAALPVVYEHPRNVMGGPALAASPETARALGALRRAQIPEAIEATERLVAAFPEEPAAHILRAAALYESLWDHGVLPAARQALEAGLDALDRVDPANPYSKLYRAGYRREVGGEQGAVLGMLNEVLDRDDLSPALRGFVLSTRGWIQRKGGRIDEALADLEEARRLDPADAMPLREIGITLRESGRREDALVFGQQAAALEPSWMNLSALAWAYSDLGRYAEAASVFERSCEDSQKQQDCAGLASALHRSGERDRGRQAATKAARLPNTVLGLYNLGCYYAVAGERSEAIGSLRKALDHGYAESWIREDPDLASLHGDPEFESIVDEVKRHIGAR